jgi:hypothetical protein
MTLQANKPIDSTVLYNIYEPTFMCCDQSQFTYYCKAHEEKMGCYFCQFDYSEPCGHGGELPQSEMDALRAILQASIIKSKERK